jgi:hypothetical protein
MRRFFIFIFLSNIFLSKANAFTSEQWQVVSPSPSVFWTVSDNEIIGVASQLTPDSFLISSPEFFPVTADFIWQFSFIPQQGVGHNIVWGFIDEDNYYQLHFYGGALWVNRFINGQEMLARGINFSWNVGETYMVKIIRKNGMLNIFVNDQEVFSFYDWTYDEIDSVGNWGFKMSPGTIFPVESIFRDIRFFEEDLFILPIEKIMQNDPLWSDEIYDHADLWSNNPTIARWGCALSSTVMILKYHGFHFMPDGETLNPATVNNWLQQQVDGYIADGLVNWWAVTRLVKTLSNQSKDVLDDLPSSEQLPMLEFSVVKENILQTAEVFIRADNPVIVQTPGHFVVMNGFYKDSDDFVVTDPLFPKTKASEYEEIQSLRVFQPSFTDLSALVVVHDSSFQVKIYDEEDNEQETKKWSEFLEEDFEQSKKVNFTVIEKPTSGEYIVEFINQDTENINNIDNLEIIIPEIYAYSADAEVSVFTLENNDLIKQKIIIDFEKNGQSSFNYFFYWDYFLEKLNIYFIEGKISEKAKNKMVERVSFIKNLSLEKQEKDIIEIIEIEKLVNRIQRHINNLELLLEFYDFYSDKNAIVDLQEIFLGI